EQRPGRLFDALAPYFEIIAGRRVPSGLDGRYVSAHALSIRYSTFREQLRDTGRAHYFAPCTARLLRSRPFELGPSETDQALMGGQADRERHHSARGRK